MSDSFRSAMGRRVVSRASAEELGAVSHLVVDAGLRRVAVVVIGRGRGARLLDWVGLIGFGPDAVVVSDESALRVPDDDRERAAVDGKLELVGRRVLTEEGNELGALDDVTFDPATGVVEMLKVGEQDLPGGALLGGGSYAVIVTASRGLPGAGA